MAINSKAAVAIGVLVIAGGATAFAVPAFGSRTAKPQPVSVFGIKSSESIYGYQRQTGWHEVAARRYAVAPPRPDAAFRDYAVQADPDTNKVCAVYASTEDEPALTRLKADLAETYGEPTVTPANGWRWSKGVDYVEVEDVDGLYHVIWDFTGSCYDKNRALSPDIVTAAVAQ